MLHFEISGKLCPVGMPKTCPNCPKMRFSSHNSAKNVQIWLKLSGNVPFIITIVKVREYDELQLEAEHKNGVAYKKLETEYDKLQLGDSSHVVVVENIETEQISEGIMRVTKHFAGSVWLTKHSGTSPNKQCYCWLLFCLCLSILCWIL